MSSRNEALGRLGTTDSPAGADTGQAGAGDGALVRDVLLLDGSTLRLRAAADADYRDVVAFYDSLSPESLYMRFHGYGRTDLAARAVTSASGVERVALIGRMAGRVVALAEYDLLREPGAAEVAFAVAEDFRGRGTATRMLEQLAVVAAQRGVRRFDAQVLAENKPMLAVFENAGFDVRRTGFSEVTVSLDITPSEAVRERIDARDHIGAVASLGPILAPKSIAVVGASNDPASVGGAVLSRIIAGGFRGVVNPVNRTEEVVSSIRAVPSLTALDEAPDLAIIATKADEVLSAVAEAAAVGAKAVLVLTSDGDDVMLLELVRAGGLRLVGPGSLGVLNTDRAVRLHATSAGVDPHPGRLAICSQSGAVGIALLGHASERGIGISSFASLGDRVDVSTNDLLELWEEDEHTAAVMLYVETFGNPSHFARIARRVSRRKPILAVKGRGGEPSSDPDQRTHAAAALRGDTVIDALFRHAGVLRFRSGDELFSAAEFFSSQPLPLGRRVGVLSNSAGVATLAVDACRARGLVTSTPATHNPALVGAASGPSEYETALRAVLADPDLDAVTVHHVELRGMDPGAVLAAISRVAARASKPVVASVVGADGRLPLRSADSVPNFLFPETCATTLARAWERREWLSRPLGQVPQYGDLDQLRSREVVEAALERGGRDPGVWLTGEEAAELLDTHGIELAETRRCGTARECVKAAHELSGPIALKADLPPPADPSEINAVLLGLEGERAVRAGWRELERLVAAAGRTWIGAVAQPLVGPGADLLVGAVNDPDLGAAIGLGPGGHEPVLATGAAFRVLPETDVEADELIDAAPGVAARLDRGGGGALERDALQELLLRFALLLRECPEIVEADLNPVRLMSSGCVILGLRMRVQRRRAAARVKTW